MRGKEKRWWCPEDWGLLSFYKRMWMTCSQGWLMREGLTAGGRMRLKMVLYLLLAAVQGGHQVPSRRWAWMCRVVRNDHIASVRETDRGSIGGSLEKSLR